MRRNKIMFYLTSYEDETCINHIFDQCLVIKSHKLSFPQNNEEMAEDTTSKLFAITFLDN